MNSVKSNKLSWKYKRFTPSGCKDIEIIKSEFAVKTHFLYNATSLYRDSMIETVHAVYSAGFTLRS